MEIEKPKLTVRHGSPDLQLKEEEFEALMDSYKEQFIRQFADQKFTEENIRTFVKNQILTSPQTILLYVDDKIAGMGSAYYFDENPAYPNNDIVELTTFAVVKDFRGQGLSEEIAERLKEEILWRCPHGRGVVFGLVTANPAMARVAQKLNYEKCSPTDWSSLTGIPVKEAYYEQYGYEPYVNWEHFKPQNSEVSSFLGAVKARIAALLQWRRGRV